MPLIYITPFQNVPKIDLTDSNTAFSLAFYALNYSYLIDLPLVGYSSGTGSTDSLLAYSATVGLPAVVFSGIDTALVDNVQLVIESSYQVPQIVFNTVTTNDNLLTDNVVLVLTPSYSLATVPFTALSDVGDMDPYWTRTVLCMAMDGANNGTVFTDSKGKVITSSNVVTKTGVLKFGTASAYFAGNGYLSVPHSTDLDLVGDFTLELWVNPQSVAAGQILAYKKAANNAQGLFLSQTAADPTQYAFGIGDSDTSAWEVAIASSTNAVTVGSWQHIAVCRSGSNFYFFIDGILVGTAVWAGVPVLGALPLYLGAAAGTSTFYTGYMDEVRITKGAARYTSNFPVPAAAFLKY